MNELAKLKAENKDLKQRIENFQQFLDKRHFGLYSSLPCAYEPDEVNAFLVNARAILFTSSLESLKSSKKVDDP